MLGGATSRSCHGRGTMEPQESRAAARAGSLSHYPTQGDGGSTMSSTVQYVSVRYADTAVQMSPLSLAFPVGGTQKGNEVIAPLPRRRPGRYPREDEPVEQDSWRRPGRPVLSCPVRSTEYCVQVTTYGTEHRTVHTYIQYSTL
jgi:hypothetical protein